MLFTRLGPHPPSPGPSPFFIVRMGLFDGLPSGWSEAKDQQGRPYYFNRSNGEVTYARPEDPKKKKPKGPPAMQALMSPKGSVPPQAGPGGEPPPGGPPQGRPPPGPASGDALPSGWATAFDPEGDDDHSLTGANNERKEEALPTSLQQTDRDNSSVQQNLSRHGIKFSSSPVQSRQTIGTPDVDVEIGPPPPIGPDTAAHIALAAQRSQSVQPTQLVPSAGITNQKDTTSIMSEVHPVCESCCYYVALTPSIGCSFTCQTLCFNWTQGCCKEAQEGCIINLTKCWINCTGCTLCKLGFDCCCCVGACALPCHKDIPCRITICYITVCPPCGFCKTVNHAKVMTGVHGAPANCEMER